MLNPPPSTPLPIPLAGHPRRRPRTGRLTVSVTIVSATLALFLLAAPAPPSAAEQGKAPLDPVEFPLVAVGHQTGRGAGGEILAVLNDPEALKDGKRVFAVHCSRCHGLTGKGSQSQVGTGPNLTDDEWLHGNTYRDILNTITNGVPGKPMPVWKMTLAPERLRNVAALVYLLSGQDIPGREALHE